MRIVSVPRLVAAAMLSPKPVNTNTEKLDPLRMLWVPEGVERPAQGEGIAVYASGGNAKLKKDWKIRKIAITEDPSAEGWLVATAIVAENMESYCPAAQSRWRPSAAESQAPVDNLLLCNLRPLDPRRRPHATLPRRARYHQEIENGKWVCDRLTGLIGTVDGSIIEAGGSIGEAVFVISGGAMAAWDNEERDQRTAFPVSRLFPISKKTAEMIVEFRTYKREQDAL